MKTLVRCLLALFWPLASAQTSPQVIEAYGDSITAGFLSHTTLTEPPPLNTLSGIWSDLATYIASGDRKRFQKLHAPELSWIGQVRSLWGGQRIENQAFSGAKTADLLTQILRAKPESESEKIVGNDAFFFVGHNDLCDDTGSVDDFLKKFRKEYTAAIHAWNKRHEKSVLFFVPPGDVNRVYRTLEGFKWYDQGPYRFTCNQSWETLFPFCRQNTMRKRAGTLSEHLIPRMEGIRRSLADLAVDWNRKSEGNRFFFLEKAVNNVEYRTEYFAVDCYHLSAMGQKFLAENILAAIRGL